MWYVSSSRCTLVILAFALAFSASELAFASMAVSPAPRQQLANSQANYLNAQNSSQVKSYREWKQFKISEAEGRLKTIKEAMLRSKGLSLSATEAGLSSSLRRMLDNEELQFDMAQDLTISDYFVGYLTKQKSLNQAIKEVSGKLSAEEVAELMTAYADNFFSSKPSSSFQPSRAESGL